MTQYQLWPATSGPGSAAVDASGESLGVEFYVTDPGLSIRELRFWRADTTILGPITGRVYTVADASTGTPLAGTDVTFTLSGTGWQTATPAAPVALTANQRYRAVIHFPTNYSATSHYWDSGAGAAGITTWPLNAPNTGGATGGDQGSFTTGSSLTFSTSSFNSTNYWVDVTVAGGQVVTLGQATETDTAGHNAAAKNRRLGQAVTVEAAQPVAVAADVVVGGFPDIEAVLVAYLADLGDTGTRTPADLQERLPFLRIHRAGGNDDTITDRPRVTVDVFAATRAAAMQIAETVRQRLTVRGPILVDLDGRQVVVDRTGLLSGPVEVPWPDPQTRVFTAAYQLDTRRQWP